MPPEGRPEEILGCPEENFGFLSKKRYQDIPNSLTPPFQGVRFETKGGVNEFGDFGSFWPSLTQFQKIR